MKFRLFVAFIATLLARPFTVSAAITELPFGGPEKLVQYYLQHTRTVTFSLWFPGEYVNVFLGRAYTTENGEPIDSLAKRSQDEFVAFVERKMQEATLSALKEFFTPEMAGQEFIVGYTGETSVLRKGRLSTQTIFRGMNYFSVTLNNGVVTVSPDAFVADLSVAVTYSAHLPILVQGIKSASFLVEAGSGPSMEVWPEEGILWVENSVLATPTKGQVRIQYDGDREEVTDTETGETLITYLSPPVAWPGKRLGIPKVTEKGIELPYEATDDEQVLIRKASPDFTVWYPLPYIPVQPPVEPSGISPASTGPVRIRTATAPRDNNGSGFFRAEVVSAVAPLEVQKR